MTGGSPRHQTPKCCHNRKYGLCPSISSCRRFAAEMALALSRPNIRGLEHFLWLLNIVDNAFNVHSVQISNMSAAAVKRDGINDVSAAAPPTQ
jgi:hypothetical protein